MKGMHGSQVPLVGTSHFWVTHMFKGFSGLDPRWCRYITEKNAERLADALCRMRGAALKLGQMISIQDENVLPPAVCSHLCWTLAC